jgi:hypothetical protein
VPRDLIQAPDHNRDRSLGWLAVAWLEFFTVHGRGDVQGDAVEHGDELTGFLVDCYAVTRDPAASNCSLLYDSAFLSRPKGCDKSGLAARIGLFEALGPCRLEGWARGDEVLVDPWGLGFEYRYAPGEPMGKPVRAPFLRCMATEEGQTGNVYDSIYYNLTEGPLQDVPGVDAGLTRVLLHYNGGEIRPSTAANASKDGGIETWVDFDETHLYKTPELRRMHATVTRNLRKRKRTAGTWYLETTTMFAAGEDSVAEETYKLAEHIREGQARRQRLLYDHRWGECEDLADEPALREAITDAYGDAIVWNDLDGLVDEFYDPRKTTTDSRRFFLNARSSAADAWLVEHEWSGCFDGDRLVADGDVITLGFDGSRARAHGVTDATALIACRVSDGHVFEPLERVRVGAEDSDGRPATGWRVPTAEVERAVAACFRRYTVVGFFADPAKWESYVAAWEAKYGPRMKVKATREHPIEWWMTGGRSQLIVKALEEFHNAVIDREMTHDGAYALTRHVLNARRRATRAGCRSRRKRRTRR